MERAIKFSDIFIIISFSLNISFLLLVYGICEIGQDTLKNSFFQSFQSSILYPAPLKPKALDKRIVLGVNNLGVLCCLQKQASVTEAG